MDNKKRKKRKKGRLLDSRFYRIYFTVVGVALVLIVIGLIWLNGLVRDYEISQPAHAAEVVVKLFEDGDCDRLYELDTAARDIAGGDKAFYTENLSALLNDAEITWREAYSPSDDERRYNVSLDGERLATFTLVPSGETTGHGNRLWKLGSITTNLVVQDEPGVPEVASAPYRVSAPEGYTVSVNGTALTQANAVGTGEPILPEGFAPTGVTVPAMITYAFDSPDQAPALTCVDETGAEAEVLEDGENAWRCPLKQNEAFVQQYGDAVIKLAERVAKYTVKDLSRNAIMSNVASDSPAETILKKFSNEWAPSHRTATVSDAKVSEFYVLSDDCFTCHVEFTFTLRTRRGNDYVYPTSYTFCVIRRKGTGKLYNLTFN